MHRDPYDGEPYYCKVCECGYGEYMACELPDCQLEDKEVAQLRKRRRKPPSSDLSNFQSRKES